MPKPPKPKHRATRLTTRDMYALDRAVSTVIPEDWPTYLVGSAETSDIYRDVDVRTILDDRLFDQLFPSLRVWECWCFLASDWLTRATGLPIDYQVQRRTEANERYDGPRNPLGRSPGRAYAGGGDATPYTPSASPPDPAPAPAPPTAFSVCRTCGHPVSDMVQHLAHGHARGSGL